MMWRCQQHASTRVVRHANKRLRGKWLIDQLSFLPDPTKTQDDRDVYIRTVVPFSMISGLAMTAPFYGFNVWLIPMTLHIYGPEATYSLRTGSVLYVFSSQLLAMAITGSLLAPHIRDGSLSTGLGMLTGTVLSSSGLALTGLFLEVEMYGGLILSQFVLCGIGAGFCMTLIGYHGILWFRETNRPALGAGLHGFFAGLWPALFSFWGAALENAVGIGRSFYCVALMVALVQVPAILLTRSPTELPLLVQKESVISEVISDPLRAAAEDENGDADDKNIGNVQMSRSDDSSSTKHNSTNIVGNQIDNEVETFEAQPALTRRELLSCPQIWLQCFFLFMVFLPGFGIKYTISPLMSTIFSASEAVQSVASFLYLMSYSVTRLFVGFVAEIYLTPTSAAKIATGIQLPSLFFMGSMVKLEATSNPWMWAFVVAMMVVGCGLAASKVCIPLGAIENWGIDNLAQVNAMLQLSAGVAGVLGPFWIWFGLSRHSTGDLYIDDSLNDTEEDKLDIQKIMGNHILMFGACVTVGWLGEMFCVRKYKKVVHHVVNEGTSGNGQKGDR
mmetsp:Transcript_35839/g.78507  ORF Transcript_35839/g.78507 Transcript_35839/m.78507 type:complete len:559 (-) Transcript_35839:59-1735(-)